jgi:hypothetical protein
MPSPRRDTGAPHPKLLPEINWQLTGAERGGLPFISEPAHKIASIVSAVGAAESLIAYVKQDDRANPVPAGLSPECGSRGAGEICH